MPVDLHSAAERSGASARQNYAPAQEALGIGYEFGEDVVRNRQTAIFHCCWRLRLLASSHGQLP